MAYLLGIHLSAAMALVFILWLFVLLWPVPMLGYTYDSLTGQILAVERGSPAGQSGIEVGDRIVELYGQPWEAVQHSVNVLSLLDDHGQSIPIVLERDLNRYKLSLRLGEPTVGFQAVKLIHLWLALLCWLTGYLLGVVKRNEAGLPEAVGLFWLAISVLVMGYFFAVLASLPLRLGFQWFTVSTLVPLAIYVHAKFPRRSLESARQSNAHIWLVVSVLVLNLGLAAAVFWYRPTLSELVQALSGLLPVALLAAFLTSGALLIRDYQRTVSAHMRRQMRLIGLACLVVAVGWVLFLVIPVATNNLVWLANQGLNGMTALIPLAYLVSGITPDLYRVDRTARRITSHLLAISVIFVVLAGARLLILQSDVLLLTATICAVALYRPTYGFSSSLLGVPSGGNDYEPLAAAMRAFTTTLDSSALAQACVGGVRRAFVQPPLAFYLGDPEGSNDLQLVTQEQLPHLPVSLASGALTEVLMGLGHVNTSREVERALSSMPLSQEENQALYNPGLVLWCPICHADGHLLGLLLLGRRGDLDMYRPQDVRELQRLCDAAALAFGHSAAYQRRLEAEQLNRELYRELEVAQAAAGARLARELHDEVINGSLRLNIQALRQLINGMPETWERDELQQIAEVEESVVEALRMICEDLHPTAIDDPLGLEANLRIQIGRVLVSWPGSCTLAVVNDALPVPAVVQREAMKITGEALTNIVKHAQATTIGVTLTYPAADGEPLEVVIRDNGVGMQRIRSIPGHRGLRDMRERARLAGGSLTIRSEPGVGTVVTFRCAVDAVATTRTAEGVR